MVLVSTEYSRNFCLISQLSMLNFCYQKQRTNKGKHYMWAINRSVFIASLLVVISACKHRIAFFAAVAKNAYFAVPAVSVTLYPIGSSDGGK